MVSDESCGRCERGEDLRMQKVCRVAHAVLKGPVQVRERFGRAAETHALAEVVPALVAVVTVAAHDPALDRDALADTKTRDLRAKGGNGPSSFMAEHEGLLDGKVTVPTMEIVVHWTPE